MTTVQETDLVQIVSEIWTSMLGLEPVPWAPDEAAGGGREVRAAVQITGSWTGALVIECPEPAAQAFAAAMLGMDPGEELAEDELRDVVGELANMAGGNLKALVGVDTRLSLPTVVVGADLHLSVPGASIDHRLQFQADGQVFTVMVLSSAAQSLQAAG
ncbi:MAG TPA: chemotaxis protein CheX [Acidimicrobiales bacterium]|nr:chemotaxis protein CheX [Acidimicrobiales bacterium]